MTNPRDIAAELYNAMLQARCDAGEVAREVLDMLAANTGQNSFRHAASVLRGTRLGRNAIDDREALRRIAAFPPDRQREAVGIVAADMARADGKKIEAHERRLRRKRPANETDKMVLSANSIP
jgi:hypothetical protein